MVTYPEFKPIEFKDKPFFEAILAQERAQTSELSFANLYAWSGVERSEFSMLDGLIIVRQGAKTRPYFYEPIGAGRKKEVIAKIILDSNGVFTRVSKNTALAFENDSVFSLTLERDHFDYLYNVDDLVFLAGSKYDGKRNLIRQFKTSQVFEYIRFDAETIHECLSFEEQWCLVKGCEQTLGSKEERDVLDVLVRDFSRLGLIAAGIKIGPKLCAIAIASRLNRETMLVHILKAYSDIVGLYQTMLHEFLSDHSQDFRYVNLEDDMGVDGLRKAKLSYHPAGLIEKYHITKKGDSHV